MRKLISMFLLSFSLTASISAVSSESEEISTDSNEQSLIDTIFGMERYCEDYPLCVETEEQEMIRDSQRQKDAYSKDDRDNSKVQPK